MNEALAEQILKAAQDDDPVRSKMRLVFIIKVMLCGTYVGSCPYCKHGDIFRVKDLGDLNLGKQGAPGCACTRLTRTMEDIIG